MVGCWPIQLELSYIPINEAHLRWTGTERVLLEPSTILTHCAPTVRRELSERRPSPVVNPS